MSPYIQHPYIREASVAVFIVLALLLLLSWLWTVSRVETAIIAAIRRGVPAAHLPQFKIFVAWALAVGFFALEVMTFLYR